MAVPDRQLRLFLYGFGFALFRFRAWFLLSSRNFASHDDDIDHWCEAWNNIADQPWRIMTTAANGQVGSAQCRLV